MNKIKRFFAALLVSIMLFSNTAIPVGAVAPWNATGDYDITFFLTGNTTPFVHDATLIQTGSSIDGVGGHPANAAHIFEWDILTGSIIANTINLDIDYTLGAIGTNMDMIGTVAPDGTVTGTWTDNFGGSRDGTWSITSGVSVPRIHIPANGDTVTQSALVKVDWTDAIGSNPPFLYEYQAFPDSTYTTPLFGSGMTLTASEIPTPGTAPGTYFLRVRAQNSVGAMSAWSNGSTNPYSVTVISDPVNPFPVPAECDQTIAYNLIDGTNGSEVLNGTSGPDLILAGGGSDVVNGLGGNDCIVGGNGSDLLKGGSGNDVILGGSGSDSLMGENDNDKLYGQAGSDSLKGGNGNDDLLGGDDSDSLKGEAGDDTLDGQGGIDAANGGLNTDACTAESETACEI